MVLRRGTKSTVREKVEAIVRANGCTYLEALTHFMTENSFTPSRMAKSMCPYLFGKLYSELKHNRLVRSTVLAQFFSDGKLKMDKEQAIDAGQKIQSEIDNREAILNMIREKKRRAEEDMGPDVSHDSELLVYETKLEEELEILIDLSILCSVIAGE